MPDGSLRNVFATKVSLKKAGPKTQPESTKNVRAVVPREFLKVSNCSPGTGTEATIES